ALVEAAEGLVALEDVLEGAPPRGVDAERRAVRGDRAVDERPDRAAAVLLTERLEGTLPLPAVEQLELERGMIGLVRQRREHVPIVPREETASSWRLKMCNPTKGLERTKWQPMQPAPPSRTRSSSRTGR